MGSSTVRSGLLALVLVVSGLTTSVARAEESPVQRAASFLETKESGVSILEFLHLGKEYRGHRFKELRPVVDGDGDQIPGFFALVYRFHWGTDGYTDLGFLCDAGGSVYKLEVAGTNAIINEPFLGATISIKFLGGMLMGALAEKLDEQDRRALKQLVEAADAQGLLTLGLRLKQAMQ